MYQNVSLEDRRVFYTPAIQLVGSSKMLVSFSRISRRWCLPPSMVFVIFGDLISSLMSHKNTCRLHRRMTASPRPFGICMLLSLLYRVPSGFDVLLSMWKLAMLPPAWLVLPALLPLSASQGNFVDVLDGYSSTSATCPFPRCVKMANFEFSSSVHFSSCFPTT